MCSPILEEMQLALNHSDGVEFVQLAGIVGWVRSCGGGGGGFGGVSGVSGAWVGGSGRGVGLGRSGIRACSAS